jgi:hypothetical protein
VGIASIIGFPNAGRMCYMGIRIHSGSAFQDLAQQKESKIIEELIRTTCTCWYRFRSNVRHNIVTIVR